MAYQIRIEPGAGRSLNKIPREIQERLIGKIYGLADDPHPPGAVLLKGRRRYWRIRSGAYRIVYQGHDTERFVHIILAGHRREIYRQLGDIDT